MAEKEVTLLDVIDRAQLQSLQDAFAKATGMAALATDKSGPVTQLSCPTDFCMNYTRKSSVGCERCNLCDLKGGEQASRTGKPAVYYCHGGLVDFASPIIVNGKQIGSLIGGQVLTEDNVSSSACQKQKNKEQKPKPELSFVFYEQPFHNLHHYSLIYYFQIPELQHTSITDFL